MTNRIEARRQLVSRALLLAGLRPDADSHRPLELYMINGTPLIVHALHTLVLGGVNHVTVAIGRDFEEIRACIESSDSLAGITKAFVPVPAVHRNDPLSATLSCRRLPQAPFMVASCNRLHQPSLVQLMCTIPTQCPNASFLLVDFEFSDVAEESFGDSTQHVIVAAQSEGWITGGAHPVCAYGSPGQGSTGIDTGLMVWDQNILQIISSTPSSGRHLLSLPQVLQMAAEKHALFAVSTDSYMWCPVEDEAQLFAARPLLSQISGEMEGRLSLPAHSEELGASPFHRRCSLSHSRQTSIGLEDGVRFTPKGNVFNHARHESVPRVMSATTALSALESGLPGLGRRQHLHNRSMISLSALNTPMEQSSMMRKVQSLAALSELEESTRSQDLIRLSHQVNQLRSQINNRSSYGSEGHFFKTAWIAAVLTNTLLGVHVFWKQFFFVMKQGVNTRTILREVWRRQPIRKVFRKPNSSGSGISRYYNRGGLQAAKWSFPLFLFAASLSRADPASVTQTYTVFLSCLYSVALPSVTGIRMLYCALNIVTNLVYSLSRFIKAISVFESISF